MFERLKRLFIPKQCAICKMKPTQPQKYINDQKETVLVCRKCISYAERRAMRKM
ncbi:hypothetical protein SAMN04487936_101450 [Halobacillus dabanensis]|uniref:Uncharacterized protein n=1 Tax=Halobacillus dabanensis TaxID=240302 RepID=A0A1I3PV15_HALDA|nr:hypothetical protein [Halobacillus dabanensis]SFJ25260.1 hypothetical protein SAMN04487936_101450 [Halobacillus dabanensis]